MAAALKEIEGSCVGGGGLTAYFGAGSFMEVEKKISEGDKKAKTVFEAMARRIAQEISAKTTVLKGKIDAVVFTGGLANSKNLVNAVKKYLKHVPGKRMVYAGEFEMEALKNGALRVMNGEENPLTYKPQVK